MKKKELSIELKNKTTGEYFKFRQVGWKDTSVHWNRGKFIKMIGEFDSKLCDKLKRFIPRELEYCPW